MDDKIFPIADMRTNRIDALVECVIHHITRFYPACYYQITKYIMYMNKVINENEKHKVRLATIDYRELFRNFKIFP